MNLWSSSTAASSSNGGSMIPSITNSIKHGIPNQNGQPVGHVLGNKHIHLRTLFHILCFATSFRLEETRGCTFNNHSRCSWILTHERLGWEISNSASFNSYQLSRTTRSSHLSSISSNRQCHSCAPRVVSGNNSSSHELISGHRISLATLSVCSQTVHLSLVYGHWKQVKHILWYYLMQGMDTKSNINESGYGLLMAK